MTGRDRSKFKLSTVETEVFAQTLILHPARAAYWSDRSALLIADLHLGKEAHFRKEGLAIPDSGMLANLANINRLLKVFQPRSVVFLGDLFHSSYNRSWEQFGKLLKGYRTTEFHLVSGNHDILAHQHYHRAGMNIHAHSLLWKPFLFTHKPQKKMAGDQYNLSGHLHPGVFLKGKGRQSVKLPCFWLGQKQGVLPAFGKFTGLAIVRPKATDQVYVVLKDQVLRV